MPDKLFRGDITNSVADLTLLDEEVLSSAGTSSYRLGNTNNGEILTVSKGDFPDYTFGSNPYYGDANFKGLVIGTSCTTIGELAFSYCDGLVGSLVIPDSVTSIGLAAFESCFNLTGSLTIGNSVTSIGQLAFLNCGFTGDLVIPDSVASIGSDAFYGCSGLTGDLVIPNSVTSIGGNAFANCSNLTTAYLAPPLANVGSGAFSQSGLTTVYAKDAATNGWTEGAGQTVGGKTGVTVANWNNYPIIP